jgi:hypothetical protein
MRRFAVRLKRFLVLVTFEEYELVGFLRHAMTEIDQHTRFVLLDRGA